MIRLNWFSPLPPAQTDIAHYTGRILPALARRTELTLWTDRPDWDRGLERFATVHFYGRRIPRRELESGVNVFNIGNDRKFHAHIYRLACAHPGIVILHDLHLPNLIGKKMPWSRTSRQADHLPLLKYALGVIVHTSHAAEAFRRDSSTVVVFHPLPYQAHDWARSGQKKSDAIRRLIIFGFLGGNRRLDIVVKALRTYPRREMFRLDIYGKISKRNALERLIRQFGLRDVVTIHGFVPERELDEALERAGLAINLRFPTMGEASGSQLRIWDHALPSIVTRAGWYADLPTSTVGYISLENEIPDLHHHFDAFVEDPVSYANIGQRGRKELLKYYTPESYADAIVQLAEKATAQTSIR